MKITHRPSLPPVLLLAAGASSRMGHPKGLLDFDGHPWFLKQVERITSLGTSRIILVLGFHAGEFLKHPIPYSMVHLALNPLPHLGPFSSIQAGIGSLHSLLPIPTQCFVLPIDVPCPRKDVWEQLLASMDGALLDEEQVCIPTYSGQGGHPVLLSAPFQKRLLDLSPHSSSARLDLQIQALPSIQVKRVEVEDPLIRKNLNTPEDWTLFKSGLSSKPTYQ